MNKFAKQFLPLFVLSTILLGACTNPFFTALLKDKGKPGNGGFTPQTNSNTVNDVATLGLVGTDAVSSNTSVATVKIEDGNIVIASVAEGSAVITVSGSGYTSATIPVTVGTDGTITVGEIRPGVPAYTVTFESNGGSSVPAQTVAEGGKATEPPAPAKEDYLLEGWYKEAELTNQWDFITDTVTADMTLYAYWIPFKMVPVPISGSITFPTGTSDNGTATVAGAIGETEITYELWYTVRAWAEANGYAFFNNPGREGSSAASQNTAPGANRQEPVTIVSWFDAVVWLNALTEWVNEKTRSSLVPVYYYESACTTVAKNSDYTSNFVKEDGSHSHVSAYAKTDATGFRLPTSNEWELAARWRGSDPVNTVSGYTNPYFTKGDSASGATADRNDAAATGEVAWYDSNSSKTQAVKGKTGNWLGLYDMSGNVWEWCYDWYPSYDGSLRILRGGGWNNGAYSLQVSVMRGDSPGLMFNNIGFRPARTAQ